MEDIKLISLWNSYEEKFNDSYSLIQKNMQDITQLKVQNFLSSMKPIKIFTILTGILWVLVVGTIVTHLFIDAYSKVNPFFLFSATIQVILTAIAIIVYLYQLVLIYQVDISQPVLKTQETLVHLKTSTLWVTRILFLQLPVWTTFFLSKSMFANGNTWLLILQGIITLSFAFFAVWFFLNIKYENRNKKWFRLIFNGKEWTPLLNSMELINQLNDYKEIDKKAST